MGSHLTDQERFGAVYSETNTSPEMRTTSFWRPRRRTSAAR